jgi:hypothetical protein
MIVNRVYSALIETDVLPGLPAIFNINWRINNYGRSFKLKYLDFDIQISQRTVPIHMIPLEENTNQEFVLQVVGFPAGTPVAETFEDISIPAVFLENGLQFNLYKPKQLRFDSFYVRNSLQFFLIYTNWDLLLTYHFRASIIVEIEETESTQ